MTGTGGEGALMLLELSELNEASGAFLSSSISFPNIDPHVSD
jgi:hypothetical protein